MRPKSMILIVIALGCGLVASIGISQVMENKTVEAPPQIETEQIYVALTDVSIGEELSPQSVKLEEWPKDKVPPGAIYELEELEGRSPKTRLYPGEPILAAKLRDSSDPVAAATKIPAGYRVVSVKVTMDSSASGLIQPGDKVDVLVFLKAGRGISTTGTRTILKKVTVFAVNDQIQREIDEEGATLKAKTVSLLVKPSQVERLTLADALGSIKLSLRRGDDDSEDSATGATVADLNNPDGGDSNGSILAGNSTQRSHNTTQGGITKFLDEIKYLGEDGGADTTIRQGWVMHIHKPNGIEVFNWDDRDSLPRELMSFNDSTAASYNGDDGESRTQTQEFSGENGSDSDSDSSASELESVESPS